MTTYVAVRSDAPRLVLIGSAPDPVAECARLSDGHPFTVSVAATFPQLEREELATAFEDIGHNWVAATLLDVWAALAHTELRRPAEAPAEESDSDDEGDSPQGAPAKRKRYTDCMGWTLEVCPKGEAPMAADVRRELKTAGGLPLYKALAGDLKRTNTRRDVQTVKILTNAAGEAVRLVPPPASSS
jgi:hypothetical protein